MKNRATLKQVAARAGVSYQTVSKVLNNKIKVSKETDERIWESIRALGYRPNQIARNLRSQRSHLIGYSWEPAPPDQANPILDHFLQSMAHAAETAGYHLLAFPYHAGKELWIHSYQELIDTNRVDGFVLSSVEYNDPRIGLLRERRFPFVAFGRSNPEWDFPFVDVDGGVGIRLVMEHLLEQGHQRFAALAWPEASRVGQNRMEGFFQIIDQAGIVLGDR
jgi:DNA-binding LacI/PurR family transcriptional regulator